MTTISDVQEGKSNYFTLEEIDGAEVIFVEDIDVSKPLRSHKVEGKGEGKKKEAEYFDFAVQCENIVKDIGLTYTGLKQLSEVVPKDLKNWQGIRIKYSGTKGTGKNIKYKWEYLGIAAKGTYQSVQTTIVATDSKPAMADYMKKILDKLGFAGKVYPDGIPASIFAEVIEAELKAAKITEDGAFNRVLTAMKGEGLIFEPKAGFFKVVV